MQLPQSCKRMLALTLVATPVFAQDSVSKSGCLPGDGVAPWDDATAPFGSEQCNDYVVDLAPLITSWNTVYGIGPIMKSSKIDLPFFGSLVNSQGISRQHAQGVPFSASSYSSWAGVGFGINNDPTINDPGAPVDTSNAVGHRFGVAFSEFGTASGGASYEGIIGGTVNVDPQAPGKLYVSRTVAATNGCDPLSSTADLGFGSVDEDGELTFRADSFTATGSTTCVGALGTLSTNDVFRVETAARNCNVQNVISEEAVGGGGLSDGPAMTTILPFFGATANVPGIVSGSIVGGDSLYIGTDFNTNYVRGDGGGPVGLDMSHLGPGVTDHRGNISHSVENYPFLGNSAGTCAVLGQNEDGETIFLNIFGIDTSGNVTGTQAAQLPQVTDPTGGFTSVAAPEYGHYFSQVAFGGGNGQIALGQDQAGRLIVAATADNGPSAATNTEHFISVARIDPGTGATTWSVAAWNNSSTGGGKAILNGPSASGGTAIGQLSDFQTFTGSALPSIGPPMIDGVGNIWFIAVVEIFDPLGGASDFGTGLLRAVYDPATFSYELELIFDTGTVFTGLNSGLNYQLSFLPLADSNSLSSGTAFSQNIMQGAHMEQCPQGLDTKDSRTLGGMVLNAEIVYDYNSDTSFTQCTGAGGDPASPDQDYNVLLYLSSLTPASDLNDDGKADEAQKLWADKTSLSLSAGGAQNFTACAGPEDANRIFVFTGTVGPTTPGFPFQGFVIPITFDFYTIFLLNSASTPFGSTLGFLDPEGKGTAAWTIPPNFDPTLAGITANHCYVVLDAFFQLADVSNPWPLTLNP